MLPTTERSADTLAYGHGYKSLTDLAYSLPPQAKVLDVGAGASSLGSVVAQLRPDVHWTNLDFSYHDRQILKDISRDAPPNLTFIAGDVTKLDDFVEPASMDAVFSYWLFPHLSLYDKRPALTAAVQVYKAVKSGGILAVGPQRHPIFHPATFMGKSWRIGKDGALTAELYSHAILRKTRLSAANRYVRIAFDTAAAELFGTSRYVKGNKIYNPETAMYIWRYRPQAICLVGKLLIMAAVRIVSPRRLDANQGS